MRVCARARVCVRETQPRARERERLGRTVAHGGDGDDGPVERRDCVCVCGDGEDERER